MRVSIFFLLASPALLLAAEPDSTDRKIPEHKAIRVTNPIKLDGLLSEADWMGLAAFGFTQDLFVNHDSCVLWCRHTRHNAACVVVSSMIYVSKSGWVSVTSLAPLV